MKVRDLMTRDPIAVQDRATLDDAMELMDLYEIRHLPVLADGRLVGVLSDRDLLDATGWLHPRERAALEAPQLHVRACATGEPRWVPPDAGLGAAVELLLTHRIGCLPVLDGGALLGILTETDVLRSYADACRTGGVRPDDDPRLSTLMTADPRTVEPDASGDEARAALAGAGVRHLPVVEDGRLVGMLSDRDVRRVRGRGQLETTLVREMMTPDPQTARPDEHLCSAALLLVTERISALPVLAQDGLVGLVTLVDVLPACARALHRET